MNTQYEIVINLAIIVTTPTNRLVDGSCCLSSESPPQCTSCPNVRLQLCVRDDGADTSNTDITNCTGSSVGIGSGSISGSVTAAFSYDETYTVSTIIFLYYSRTQFYICRELFNCYFAF